MIKSISPIFERCPVRSLINSFPETQSLSPHSTLVPPLYPRQIHSDQRTPQTLEGISSIQFVHQDIYIYTSAPLERNLGHASLLVNAFSRASYIFSPPRFENQFPNLGINSSPVNVYIYMERVSEGKPKNPPGDQASPSKHQKTPPTLSVP